MANRLLQVLAGAALFACSMGAAAQAYPAKPIRIIVPFGAGSGADSNSRFYGDLLSRAWGRPWWSRTGRAAAASSRRWR